MEYRNEVIMYGKVLRELEFSHEFDGIPFYSIDIMLSKPKSNRGLPIIRCYFSGDQLAKEKLLTGELVHITGELINSKVEGLIDISVLVKSYEIISEIKKDDQDIVSLSGEVSKMFTNESNYKGFVNFVIARFDENGKKTFSSKVIVGKRLGDYIFNNLKIGDKVLVTGTINNSVVTVSNKDNQEVKVLLSEISAKFFTKLDED